jgi:pSer/pThr/pTyr-binding forkhead associated (FHA) protein
MRTEITTITATRLLGLLLAFALPRVAFAKSEPERTLEVRAIERNGENHARIFLSAFEKDGERKYPITTLDSNSFMLSVDGEIFQKPNFSLTTFAASRKWNTRAVVWLYDASGVRTIKNLTRELRMLAAQEFPHLQSDYLSIAGVASGKNFERVLLDPQNQENMTVLQRQLNADSVSLKSSSITRELPVCYAAGKFSEWQKRGLRTTDQKTLILMGGSSQLSDSDKKKASECAELLKSSGVVVYQVVFARPENYNARLWMPAAEKSTTGSTHRVVNLGGASRALQTIRSSIDNEYIISAQVPADVFWRSRKLVLQAKYHSSVFQSEPLKLPNASSAELVQNAGLRPELRSQPVQLAQPIPPQRMIVLTEASTLAFDAWLEWLATSFLIGIVVTVRHMQRINSGIIEIPESEGRGDVSTGPLLVVLNGRDKGREFRIRQQTTVLGKGWNCDLRLQALKVKRKHGQLEIQGDKAILRDLSEGELYVNGRAVRSLRVIGHGSVIRLGDLQLLFQCGET